MAPAHPKLRFPESADNARNKPKLTAWEKDMSRFTLGLAVVACLMLTAYFGAAAWSASDDPHMDITGSIGPAVK